MIHKKQILLILLAAILFSLIPLFVFSVENNKTHDAISLKNNPSGRCYLGMSLPSEFQAFNETSPWNTPIPETPEIDPFSDLMINQLKYKAKVLKSSTTKWTIPIHVVDSENCPKVDVKTTSKVKNFDIDPDRNNIIEGLPVPDEVWADPERDAHMALVDPKARKSWDFSRMNKLPDNSWIASGISVWDLNGPGYRKAFSGKYWWTYGSMGSGMPLIAGVIRPEEIEAGEIKHAILCATPINRKTIYPGGKKQVCSPPASKTDGDGIGYEYIPEGARLQLDPGLDLDSLNLSPASKIVARAMQKYGMYVGMGSSTFKLFFQNLGPNPGTWGKHHFFKDLRNIPIEKFRVLKCNLVTR